MSRAAARSCVPVARLVAITVAGSAVLSLATPWGGEPARAAGSRSGTTITVATGSDKGRVPVFQLGVNHRFADNGHGMWDPDTDAPVPLVVERLRHAGVNAVRYPGGTVANLFDWKKAVGPTAERGCQVNGRRTPQGYEAALESSYGPDEHMELVEQLGAEAVIMTPFVTGTPSDAADWVEYMNSPADGEGGSNPNGGVDWAQLRARNGHPQPYGVRWWEIGNEHRLPSQRYWMSSRAGRALRQYANGARVRIQSEMLGRSCDHWNRGSVSNGEPGQVFDLLYTPATNVAVTVTDRDGLSLDWKAAGTGGLAAASDYARVFEVDEAEGEVRFGDGEHGALLPPGARVSASYTLVRPGVFAFIRAMRKVDPRIKACVTWGVKDFIRVAGGRDYNCFAVHSYTHFKSEGAYRWANALEGHDQSMLGTARERAFVAGIKHALPRGVSLALTEFGPIWGDLRTYPEWTASMTRATYMASMWVSLLDLGVPLAGGSDMLAQGPRGLLGPAPYFTRSAEALTREAIQPLYSRGSRRLKVAIEGNPIRDPGLRNRGRYPALAVAATRAHDGEVRMLVVNRHPLRRVRARVRLRGFTSQGMALVSRVNGESYRSWNTARVTEVHLRTDRRGISRGGFTEVFPAHSVTVIRVPSRS